MTGALYDLRGNLADPDGCAFCGTAFRVHGWYGACKSPDHRWRQPDNATRLARMRKRRDRHLWIPRMHLRADGESGRCQHCGQNRALWRYRVARVGEHVFDVFVGHGSGGGDCRWCCWRETKDRGLQPHAAPGQPLVCSRCYSAEQLWEERSLADDEADAGAINRHPTPELAVAIAEAVEL